MVCVVSDVVDVDRCRINYLRDTATSFLQSTAAALFFKPDHLKLSSPPPLSADVSLQVTFSFL